MAFINLNKKQNKLKLAQEEAEAALEKTNAYINKLGKYTVELYNALNSLQAIFDAIRNVPPDKLVKYEKLKRIRLQWKQQAEKIEADYQSAVTKNLGNGAAGVGMGVAVAALGPTAAMGIATTFGVASTGTAISTLSGAAAYNAALAWLGGGALTAGGGGMAAGQAFLALAGPVGWTIAALAAIGSGLMFWKAKTEKDRLEDIFTLIAKRDTKSYSLASVELLERISRIADETKKLNNAIIEIKTFGTDYDKMTEGQQYTLGAYLNFMEAATQLLVIPISGLQPNYTEENYNKFVTNTRPSKINKNAEIFFANLFYKIEVDESDKQLIWKAFKRNKKMLESLKLTKETFEYQIIENAFKALKYKEIF